jgi:molecular chaperone DnaJ
VQCETCHGSGQVRVSQGFFQLQQACPRCRGSGKVVKNPCDTCLGQGRVRRTKNVSQDLPATTAIACPGRRGRLGEMVARPCGMRVRPHDIFAEGEHLPASRVVTATPAGPRSPTLKAGVLKVSSPVSACGTRA